MFLRLRMIGGLAELYRIAPRKGIVCGKAFTGPSSHPVFPCALCGEALLKPLDKQGEGFQLEIEMKKMHHRGHRGRRGKQKPGAGSRPCENSTRAAFAAIVTAISLDTDGTA